MKKKETAYLRMCSVESQNCFQIMTPTVYVQDVCNQMVLQLPAYSLEYNRLQH